ncbi:cyclic nucleotide-binding domain-containing protein [Legionella israelensis]|uniref:Cyclic nucleotide-binding domain-containing protein n=1 Tax=Legionella israelensis TaxID=454 RepID=A0AAX1EIN3_9GAMM|nr:cyclic nucleotide-binding domain-containing protein [Legionella israelensis]QBR84825.1 cyclic nucleotide-binding domain-containing protein [Legionella israelensis]
MSNAFRSLLDNPDFKSQVKYRVKRIKAGEKILKQGVKHHYLYFILEGTVRVSIQGKKRVRPGIADLDSDNIFGEFALFDDFPASADVVSLTESKLIEIDTSSLQTFMNAHPKIGYNLLLYIMSALIHRLQHADKCIVNLYAWGIEAHQIDKYLDE